MQEKEITIPESRLSHVLDTIEKQRYEILELQAEIKQLYDGCLKCFEVIGLAENGTVKLTKDINIRTIISGSKPTLMLLINSMWSDSAVERISEKFAFLKELMPLFEKISNEQKNK